LLASCASLEVVADAGTAQNSGDPGVEVRDRSIIISPEVGPDAFAPLGPLRGLRRLHFLFKRQRREIGKDQSEEHPMRYIADDLDMDSWVKAGLARLERYLACWRLFRELYPADAL
jgi:hypothetical protein